ncbi:hypothetical protein H1R20_g10431, partial [Candolleomyces eurysporus]
MNNFNLKYECLDARDDYKAQLKKKQNHFTKGLSHIDKNDDYADEYDDDYIDLLGLGIDDEGLVSDEYMLGTIRQRKVNQMMEAQTMIMRTGWLEVNPAAKKQNKIDIPTLEPLDKHDPLSDPVDKDDVDPLVDGPLNYSKQAADWKLEIKNAKQCLQDKKLANCPPTSASLSCTIDPSLGQPHSPEGSVKIVDLSYLQEDYTPSKQEDVALIAKIATDATLNTEQKRAFKIVAHHVMCVSSPQLKMYLGGMGGTGKSQVIKCLIKFFEARAGDFAQLPPTSGKALYYQPTADDTLPTTLFGQQTVIEQARWS